MENHLSNHDLNLLVGFKTKLESQYSGIVQRMEDPLKAIKEPLASKEPVVATTTMGTRPPAATQPDGLSPTPPTTQPPVTPPTNGSVFGENNGLPGSLYDEYVAGGGGGIEAPPADEAATEPKPKKKNWIAILVILAIIALIAYAASGKKKVKT